MVLLRTLCRASTRVGSLAGASRSLAYGSYTPPFCSSLQHLNASSSAQLASHSFSGCPRSYRGRPDINESLGLPILGNVGMRLICAKPKEEHSLPSSVFFRNFEHSGNPQDPEMKSFPRRGNFPRTEYPNVPPQMEGSSRNGNSPRTVYPIPQMEGIPRFGNSPRSGNLNVPQMEGSSRLGNFENSGHPKSAETDGPARPMDYARGLLLEDEGRPRVNNGPQFSRYGSQFSRYNVEQNADTVHIKILKNNTFVTLTDSKGNKKPGSNVSISAGALPDKAGKNSRLGAEASAEHVGRKARDIGIKSVVVKVNGYTMFKKKRQAIMSFKEGYNQSRGNQNPVVYIEDTTRRPHNGCRLKKKRRI